MSKTELFFCKTIDQRLEFPIADTAIFHLDIARAYDTMNSKKYQKKIKRIYLLLNIYFCFAKRQIK